MHKIESYSQLGRDPVINSTPKGYIVPVVLLALTALAGLAYYLLQRSFALSPEAQKIRNHFKSPPDSLSQRDLYYLAKKIESLQRQMSPLQRAKIEIFSDFFHPRIRKKFIVYIGQDNTLRVQYIAATLGRGGFGKVVRLIDLYDGKKTALKVAKLPKCFLNNRQELARAEEDLKKEHHNLMIVHASRPGYMPLGVQDQPLTPILQIVKLYHSRTKIGVGFEGSLYDGSLDKLSMVSFPLKTRLNIALQILEGMETLLANKLISHDLKPQNLLFRNLNQNRFIVHISDLGGVTHEDQLGKELNKGLSFTPAYADVSRIVVASVIPINCVQSSLIRSSEKCAIGLTIFWILTGQVPTSASSFKQIWQRSGLPSNGKYKELLVALQKSSETGFFSSFFKDNIHELKQRIELLCR